MTTGEKRWDRRSAGGIKVLEAIASGKFDLAAEDCAKQIYDSNVAEFGDYDEVKFKRNVKNMIADYLSGKKSNLKTPTKAKMQAGDEEDEDDKVSLSTVQLYDFIDDD